jgi:hypothetical protein
MTYCANCQKNVSPRRRWSWAAFIFLFGVFYLPFYLMQRPKCPSCGLSQWR